MQQVNEKPVGHCPTDDFDVAVFAAQSMRIRDNFK